MRAVIDVTDGANLDSLPERVDHVFQRASTTGVRLGPIHITARFSWPTSPASSKRPPTATGHPVRPRHGPDVSRAPRAPFARRSESDTGPDAACR